MCLHEHLSAILCEICSTWKGHSLSEKTFENTDRMSQCVLYVFPDKFFFFFFFLVQLQKIPGWTGGISNSSVALLSRAEMFWGVRFGRQWAALMHVKWSAQDSLLHLLLLSHRRRGQGRGLGGCRMPPLFSAASSDASTSKRQNGKKCNSSVPRFNLPVLKQSFFGERDVASVPWCGWHVAHCHVCPICLPVLPQTTR